jgi:hypothetical protein
MDDATDNGSENQSGATGEQTEAEAELSHSDKFIGIFAEPAQTYEKTAKFPLKTMDWFLPVLLLLVVVSISQIVMMSNSEIYFQVQQKQMEQAQKFMDKMVQDGKMTKDQENDRLSKMQDQMDKGRGALGMVFRVLGIFIVGFIIFFIVSAVYFLFSKFAFKGDGNYTSALVANGLTAYIGIVHIIIATILAIAMGKFLTDTSIASLTGADKSTIGGFVLDKIDPIKIWVYIVLSIGLAKLYKDKSVTKYIVMVFGLWILWGLLMFFAAKAVPFLQFFQ